MSESQLTYFQQHLRVERELDATPQRVFAAYTTPADIENWWGPSQYSTKVDKLEPQPGGQWRFVQSNDSEGQHGFHGVFHEVAANEKIIQTFEYEGAPGHVSLETMEFKPNGEGTLLVATAVFGAPEALDAMKSAGMEEGMLETYDRLAALVEG